MTDAIERPTRSTESTGDPLRMTPIDFMRARIGNPSLKAPPPELQISADQRTLTFVLPGRGEPVTCVVSRTALETYFWLAPNADDARTLTVFRNGLSRIHAVASRKLLAHPSKKLELSAADFAKD